MDMRVGHWRRLSTEKLMLLNCGVGEDSWESLGLQGDQISQSKGHQSWIFIGRTDAETEAPIVGYLMQRTYSFEKTLMLGKIKGRRRRGWQKMKNLMAVSIQWTWVWASSGSWRWTGRPGVLQSIGLQRVGQDCVTELNWIFSIPWSNQWCSVLLFDNLKYNAA